jgi:hypothetical protein
MNEIKISIELRIEAPSESAARQYASAHGIDVSNGKWYPNHGGNGGRLYATSTTPFPGLLQHMAQA